MKPIFQVLPLPKGRSGGISGVCLIFLDLFVGEAVHQKHIQTIIQLLGHPGARGGDLSQSARGFSRRGGVGFHL